jgi:hypothetical protein
VGVDARQRVLFSSVARDAGQRKGRFAAGKITSFLPLIFRGKMSKPEPHQKLEGEPAHAQNRS